MSSSAGDASAHALLSKATLGILCTTPARRVPGGFEANHSILRVLRKLRGGADRALLATTFIEESRSSFNDRISWPDVDLIALPPMGDTISAQWHAVTAYQRVRDLAAASDVLFARLPMQIPWLLMGSSRPRLLHFAGDGLEVVLASSDYRGPKRWAALLFAAFADECYRALCRGGRTKVVTNGSALKRKYAPAGGRVAVSSCLSRTEMAEEAREGWVPTVPQLLFVGYMRPEKGIEVLLDAFAQLWCQRRLRLTIVGGVDKGRTRAGERVRSRLEREEWGKDVRVVGEVAFGETLFDLYRSHDLLVLPSLSEGTPRVLVEARAFGCPVIASRVGGIPDSVNDGEDGLLVRAGDANQLALAVGRLLDDRELYRKLSMNGLARAHSLSLESFAASLLDDLESLLEGAQ